IILPDFSEITFSLYTGHFCPVFSSHPLITLFFTLSNSSLYLAVSIGTIFLYFLFLTHSFTYSVWFLGNTLPVRPSISLIYFFIISEFILLPVPLASNLSAFKIN